MLESFDLRMSTLQIEYSTLIDSQNEGAIQTLHDMGLFDNFDRAQELKKECLEFNKKRREELEENKR